METTQNNKKTIPYSGYLVSCSKCGVCAFSFISLSSYILAPENSQTVRCPGCEYVNFVDTRTSGIRPPKGMQSIESLMYSFNSLSKM